MKKIRIGSVGLGRLGLQHAKNIASKISGAELTALCDMDEKKLKETAEILRVPHTFTRFDDMRVAPTWMRLLSYLHRPFTPNI